MPAVSKITRPQALEIVRQMLDKELNEIVEGPMDSFSLGAGPAQRGALQKKVNTEYFLEWKCAVSINALKESETWSEMTTAILDAIPENRKR